MPLKTPFCGIIIDLLIVLVVCMHGTGYVLLVYTLWWYDTKFLQEGLCLIFIRRRYNLSMTWAGISVTASTSFLIHVDHCYVDKWFVFPPGREVVVMWS